MIKLWLMGCLLAGALIGVWMASAQEDAAPAINAANIRQLASVQTIDFEAAPPETGRFESGWLALGNDEAGRVYAPIRIATRNREGRVAVWNSQGQWLGSYGVVGQDRLPAPMLDARFCSGVCSGDVVASLHSDGQNYTVAYHHLPTDTTRAIAFPGAPDIPLSIWLESAEEQGSEPGDYPLTTHVEAAPFDAARLSYVASWTMSSHALFADGEAELERLEDVPSGPENDLEAAVRLGRIEPPLAVTATETGLVKLWNLQIGEVTATAQVDGVPLTGQVNAAGTHLAWRDPSSTALHLLDFETGEDRVIAALDGDYIQFIFLSSAADVIIGVNIALQPIVVAWDADTGERYNLGSYRNCNRVPDQARLSRDGTTLVIGCDTGLDIWQVAHR